MVVAELQHGEGLLGSLWLLKRETRQRATVREAAEEHMQGGPLAPRTYRLLITAYKMNSKHMAHQPNG